MILSEKLKSNRLEGAVNCVPQGNLELGKEKRIEGLDLLQLLDLLGGGHLLQVIGGRVDRQGDMPLLRHMIQEEISCDMEKPSLKFF